MQSNETQIQQKATAGMQSRGMAPLMCNTQYLDISTYRICAFVMPWFHLLDCTDVNLRENKP